LRGDDHTAAGGRRAALAKAGRWLAAPSADDTHQTTAAQRPWDQRAEAEALRAEARALLGKGSGTPPSP
jgi:hypothetical protein